MEREVIEKRREEKGFSFFFFSGFPMALHLFLLKIRLSL